MQSMVSTAEVQRLFSQSVQVLDSWDDGERLYCRGVGRGTGVPGSDGPFQPGVALRATPVDVWVRPFLLRRGSRNGAIFAECDASRLIRTTELTLADEFSRLLRASIESCGRSQVVSRILGILRAHGDRPIDGLLTVAALRAQRPEGLRHAQLVDVLARISDRSPMTQSELMNAVIDSARDTRDPDLRWQLEEFGGVIGLALLPALSAESDERLAPAEVPTFV